VSSVFTDYAPGPGENFNGSNSNRRRSAAAVDTRSYLHGGADPATGVRDRGQLRSGAKTRPAELGYSGDVRVARFDLGRATRPVMRPTRAKAGRVVVLIPAHNEAPSIGYTLNSLRRQSWQPDEVVVVCDNCTDDTAAISHAIGACVLTTIGNRAKKAGALNQALNRVLPHLERDDFVLAMDADSQLSDDWIRSARQLLVSQPKVGAVCGTFLGEAGAGLVGQLQRNEYVRYARQVKRHNQVPVLSGTGTMFRVRTLREVARERARRLPGRRGEFYNTSSITEDNEITFAMKTVGFTCWSAAGCETTTEVMPTWRDLFRQRLRWQNGTLTDLRRYGLTLVTARYWAKQFMLYAGFIATISCWVIFGISARNDVAFSVSWTIGIASIMLVERIFTVRKAGPAGIFLAMLLIPEFLYDLFKLTFFVRALLDSMLRRDVRWNHVVKDNA
jgi:biofilm PGA synthesis N-glycosyltransferase PgaC